jgi:hypothetical protein
LPFANRYLPRLLAENTAYTQMERMSGTWGIQVNQEVCGIPPHAEFNAFRLRLHLLHPRD